MTDERFPIRDRRFSASEDEERPVPADEQAPDTSAENTSAPDGQEVVEAEQLAAERLDQLMRLKADFENFRKRSIREQTEVVERASLRIVERLLPVIDDLERALEAARGSDAGEALLKGVEIVHKQLHDVLGEEGLERVVAEGAFDPHEHEAVSTVPGAVDEPTILEVVRPGYRLKGKNVRPALVHVQVPEGGV